MSGDLVCINYDANDNPMVFIKPDAIIGVVLGLKHDPKKRKTSYYWRLCMAAGWEFETHCFESLEAALVGLQNISGVANERVKTNG